MLSFNDRAEKYFQLFLSSFSSTHLKGLPYMHYLRNHIGDIMKLHMEMFGWGYGVFSCNAGEHLNKIIKTFEMTETNLNANRFKKIIRNIRIKQFIYPESIIPTKTEVKCSACNEIGHNRKNKSCRLHKSHPDIIFSDSENED